MIKLIDGLKLDTRIIYYKDKLGGMILLFQESRVDFRLKPDLPVYHFELPLTVARKLLKLIHSWNLEFAACDFVLTPEEELVFIEANVEGNWLWIEHELGLAISGTIAERLLDIKSD